MVLGMRVEHLKLQCDIINIQLLNLLYLACYNVLFQAFISTQPGDAEQ